MVLVFGGRVKLWIGRVSVCRWGEYGYRRGEYGYRRGEYGYRRGEYGYRRGEYVGIGGVSR